ncbi:methionyl-tRNA formyltransferase [Candidatus Berkelbacteria bacterium]|nr:methionyl-tRNA formyltransferase [Candidatus Berkelbacteria bacterium]
MKIAFLGGGVYGDPIRKLLNKHFELVSPENADLLVVASYGKILKPEEYNKPKYGTVVAHPSLLPQYRGSSPVQYTLLNGDKITGVTIIQIDELVDHGAILAQKELAVAPNDRFATLIARLAELSGEMLVKLIPKIERGEVMPVEQDHSKATFTKKLTKEDGKLALTKPAAELARQVRAFWPWPGSFVWIEDQNGAKKRLLIHQVHIIDDNFIPDLVQLEGKKVMNFAEFTRGWRGKLPFTH